MTNTQDDSGIPGRKPRRLSNIRTFSSLGHRDYSIYFFGMIGQWTSMNMQMIARSLLIYRISDSGTILGLASLANAIPTILMSLWGGAIADRIQKKYILLFGLAGSMLVSLTVALCMLSGYLGVANPGSWWVLIATAVLQGAIMGFMMPARQSIITEIVPREQLMNAISLNMMGMNAFRILAPAATGFLIDAFDFYIVYLISSAMYGLGAFCMILLPKTPVKKPSGNSAVRDIIDGMKYVRHERNTFLILVFTLFGMICSMPFVQLMPMITDDILKVGASGQGILMTVSGIGAIVGSLTLASGVNHRRGLLMMIFGAVMGLALIGFAFSTMWWLSIVVVIFVGLGQAGYRTTGNALIQHYTPREYQGRVMSFLMMELGFSGLGTFLAGVMAEYLGIQWSIGGLATVFVTVTIGMTILFPSLRKMD